MAEGETWQRIGQSVEAGDRLFTPGRGIPPEGAVLFWVVRVDADRLVIKVGESEMAIRVPRRAFEEVMDRLSGPMTTLRIGAVHANRLLTGSVDEVVRRTAGTHLACGNYVAAILEHAGLVEYVLKGRQKHVRLRARP